MHRSLRSTPSRLEDLLPGLAAFALLCASSCAEFETDRWLARHRDGPSAVTPIGRGTLVTRGGGTPNLHRVGLISLATGERRVLELEHGCEWARGSFAGPDEAGRYAYFQHDATVRGPAPPSLTELILFPKHAMERIERPRRHRSGPEWLNTKRYLRAGELVRDGERLVLETRLCEVQETALALSHATGELAYFAYDFDDRGWPIGLHVEILDLDEGTGTKPPARRPIPLGAVQVDMLGEDGPPLAWMSDDRQLFFRRAAVERPRPGPFVLDWEDGVEPSEEWRLFLLDTQTGAQRELGTCRYAWPVADENALLCSDGNEFWFVDAGPDAGPDAVERGRARSIRHPWPHEKRYTEPMLVGALDRDHTLALVDAAPEAGMPAEWLRTLGRAPSTKAVELVPADGTARTRVVPVLPEGFVSLAPGDVPSEMPAMRRSALRADDER